MNVTLRREIEDQVLLGGDSKAICDAPRFRGDLGSGDLGSASQWRYGVSIAIVLWCPPVDYLGPGSNR